MLPMSTAAAHPATITVAGKPYKFHSLATLDDASGGKVRRLPYSLKVLLENVLRHHDGSDYAQRCVDALVNWDPKAEPDAEIGFVPARTLLQDFTGVPCVVDLAAMRDAMARLGGDPDKINPLERVDLVIDHSVQVDVFGAADALTRNSDLEYERNRERYEFLRWGSGSFQNFRVVPPNTGICHQVNLEFLAPVVFVKETQQGTVAYPDSLVGTDSHTPMVNALGVLGWGVGGIEAEAAMLGQPCTMLIPQVVGFKLTGKLAPGATATDLVLTITQMLRKKGVVGKFVEYFGEGLANLSVADRATIANMSPEYGATMGFWPVDAQTLEYLRFTGRDESHIVLVEAYCREQGLFRDANSPTPEFSDVLELDLSTVVPSLAGPRRPQDRVLLSEAKKSFRSSLIEMVESKTKLDDNYKQQWLEASSLPNTEAVGTAPSSNGTLRTAVKVTRDGQDFYLGHGAVVIAAITSCTNTSNPSVMVAAGLLAKNAVEKGLKVHPWVKTSLAPGSRVVTDYLRDAKLDGYLDQLGFQTVGYGCTTCIGNSGPLPEEIADAVTKGDLVAAAVLSGNRNFEGRVNPHVRANYLASPPLVVAYALAGTVNLDLLTEPLGQGKDGQPVYLKDIWPTAEEVSAAVQSSVRSEMFRSSYANAFLGDAAWQNLPSPTGKRFDWVGTSTYIAEPPYFEGMTMEPAPSTDIIAARCLALLGDSVTTDHISPAGSIKKDSPAGKWLMEQGVDPKDFNQYGARRGHHEVMMRGTFANIRLKNLMLPGVEGGFSIHIPSGEQGAIYDVAMRYKAEKTPLVIVAGKEYGSGSSRDWAAKGTSLLGIRAVIAESYERIHRSNLVGMGVLPLQFLEGQSKETLGLTGRETFEIKGIAAGLTPGQRITVALTKEDGSKASFEARVRIDTPNELEYFRHGGILPFVLRQLAAK